MNLRYDYTRNPPLDEQEFVVPLAPIGEHKVRVCSGLLQFLTKMSAVAQTADVLNNYPLTFQVYCA